MITHPAASHSVRILLLTDQQTRSLFQGGFFDFMRQKRSKIVSRSEIKLHYAICLADGTEVISTFAEDPFVCRIGDGTLAERLELCLIGMTEGDEGEFLLSGDEVFGPASDENVQCIDKTAFPPDMSLSAGQVIAFTTPAGDEVAGIIQSLTDSEAVVNFNHPLCGQTIGFKVLILKVVNSAPEPQR